MKRVIASVSLGLFAFLAGAGSMFWFRRTAEIPELPSKSQPPVSIPVQFQGRLSLYVLAGQSNMSGRGASLPFPETGRIFLFANDYHWKTAREPLDSPDHQVDEISTDALAGTGPGLSFATELAKTYPQKIIGLIPCAKGATTIFEWERRLGDDTLYGSCLKRMRAASTMGRVEGILFFQGEWDAFDEKEQTAPIAPNWTPPLKLFQSRITYTPENLKSSFSFNRPSHSQWKDLFSDYVDSVRRDLLDPELPVVFAQIGTTGNEKLYVHWDEVKKQQSSVSMRRVAMIKTDDLERADTVHFTTQSYLAIGRRFAEGYLKLTDPQKVADPKKEDPAH